ncbi:DUF5908 family protein [Sphingomonas sp. QA11]|uniref:DUF5908 family protein n=1 Tax=Sphingomonas sp. QA11 TaxID=2950605 RepID=UPI00234BE357|nr:DUF5908 family protein [Sphingomonas sp. QA11]WCM25664.1 DUF5908 family protein [Sphingomonas sp. QA11]
MPLHISEIGVRMAVRDPGEAPPTGGSGGGGSGCGASSSGSMTGPQREALVEDCVRAVLRSLSLRETR